MKTFEACERHAVINVGTNSVKLLVADVGQTAKPVLRLNRQTFLGRGAFRTGRLQPEAIARTVAAVAELAAQAATLRPASLRILATSAAREASNGHELVQAIFHAVGLTADVLSGDQEADYVFRGVASDPAIGARQVLIVDAGGGSTEWVVGDGGFTRFRQSTRLGTSRLLERFPPGDPPTRGDLARCRQVVADFLHSEVRPGLQPVLDSFRRGQVCLVGLGGALKTIARLAAALRPEDDAPALLRKEHLCEQVNRLWDLSAQQRRNLTGLNAGKADVILAGTVIFEAVLNQFNFTELRRSSHGLCHGALMTNPQKVASPKDSASQEVPTPWLLGTWHQPTATPTSAQLHP